MKWCPVHIHFPLAHHVTVTGIIHDTHHIAFTLWRTEKLFSDANAVWTLLWQVYYLQVVLWVWYRRTGHNILAVSLSSFLYWITLHQIWLCSLTSFSLIYLSIYKFTSLVYYFEWHGSNVLRGINLAHNSALNSHVM